MLIDFMQRFFSFFSPLSLSFNWRSQHNLLGRVQRALCIVLCTNPVRPRPRVSRTHRLAWTWAHRFRRLRSRKELSPERRLHLEKRNLCVWRKEMLVHYESKIILIWFITHHYLSKHSPSCRPTPHHDHRMDLCHWRISFHCYETKINKIKLTSDRKSFLNARNNIMLTSLPVIRATHEA